MVNKISYVRELSSPEDFLRSFVFLNFDDQKLEIFQVWPGHIFANLNFRAYLVALRTAFC